MLCFLLVYIHIGEISIKLGQGTVKPTVQFTNTATLVQLAFA